MLIKIDNHEDWIKVRQSQGIGGSEAGSVLGLNKYQSNVELWEIKTGVRPSPDLSNNSAVQFGKNAELHIRELFKLNHPEINVEYHEFDIYTNDEHPFVFATLDGELTTSDGKKGVLEIKTTTLYNSKQWINWTEKIPDSYYAQILHQLAATGFDFAILNAYIRYYSNKELRATIKHYRIDRADVEEDIDYLINEEEKFWQNVKENKRPEIILT